MVARLDKKTFLKAQKTTLRGSSFSSFKNPSFFEKTKIRFSFAMFRKVFFVFSF